MGSNKKEEYKNRPVTEAEIKANKALIEAIRAYGRSHKISQKTMGEKMKGRSQSYVSKMLSLGRTPRDLGDLLTYEAACALCDAMGTSVGTVLQEYEAAHAKKLPNYDEGKFSGAGEEKTIPEPGENIPAEEENIPGALFAPEDSLVNDVSDPLFSGWFGTYHCYFYSTISSERESRCFHGTLEIPERPSGCCVVSFDFAYDKVRKRHKKYYGRLILSRKVSGAYCTLMNHEDQGEISYLVMGDPQINNSRVCCLLALVLTISGGKGTRRPCVERMIISREELSGEKFRLAKAHLLLNDKCIRVTEPRFQEFLADEALPDSFRALFPDPDNVPPYDNSRLSDYVCRVAEIPEAWVKSLSGYTDRQKQEIIDCLRLYSTAPRCNKVRQESAEKDIFELFEDVYSNSLLPD